MSHPKFEIGDLVKFTDKSFFKNYYRVVKVKLFPAGKKAYTLMCLSTKYLTTTAYEDTLELLSKEERTLLLLGADLYE